MLTGQLNMAYGGLHLPNKLITIYCLICVLCLYVSVIWGIPKGTKEWMKLMQMVNVVPILSLNIRGQLYNVKF